MFLYYLIWLYNVDKKWGKGGKDKVDDEDLVFKWMVVKVRILCISVIYIYMYIYRMGIWSVFWLFLYLRICELNVCVRKGRVEVIERIYYVVLNEIGYECSIDFIILVFFWEFEFLFVF